MRKFSKFLGYLGSLDASTYEYWQELERKNEVKLVPIITEYRTMVWTHPNSTLTPWDKKAATLLKGEKDG